MSPAIFGKTQFGQAFQTIQLIIRGPDLKFGLIGRDFINSSWGIGGNKPRRYTFGSACMRQVGGDKPRRYTFGSACMRQADEDKARRCGVYAAGWRG